MKNKKHKRLLSLTDFDESHREAVIGAVENLGMDMIFKESVKRTDSVHRILQTAWEWMADGMGESPAHDALIDECNEALKRRR